MIAYVTTYDARDVLAWSGTPFHMTRALERAGLPVDYVGPLRTPRRLRTGAKRAAFLLAGRNYHRDRDVRVMRAYAREAGARLERSRASVVLSPGAIPVAYLETRLPLVLWADATFAGLVDYYPRFSHLARQTLRDGYAMEARVLARADAVVFTSEWAARSALETYGADPARIWVVPYGPNLEGPGSIEAVRALCERRARLGECRLLFLGVDWERKGGPAALEIARRLNEAGLRTRLTVAGCRPPGARSLPAWVRVVPFVRKSTREGRRVLARLLSESHFLLLPTVADCTPLVLSEAAAFGLPSLVAATGGIPAIVRPGRNGALFPPGDVEGYCAFVASVLGDPRRYAELAESSFAESRERLSWNVSAARVGAILRSAVGGRPLARSA